MRHPCTACVIIDGLTKEILAKVSKKYPQVEYETVTLNHPNEIKQTPGMEVEKLPAIIIDGEQFTAGSLPRQRDLEAYIQTMIE